MFFFFFFYFYSFFIFFVNVLKKFLFFFLLLRPPRISTSIRLGTRIDRNQTMEDKIKSVEQKLFRS